jgi:hypothetical protein
MAVFSGKELCPLNQAGPHIESTRTRKTLQMENEKARHTITPGIELDGKDEEG